MPPVDTHYLEYCLKLNFLCVCASHSYFLPPSSLSKAFWRECDEIDKNMDANIRDNIYLDENGFMYV